MRIFETSDIDCPPERAWRHIIEPARFLRWNEKVERTDEGPEFTERGMFRSRYRMGGKTVSCRSVAAEIVPGRLLLLRHTHPEGSGINPRLEITERFEVAPRGDGCRVTKEIVITNDGIPWWIRPFLWLFMRFAKPVGPDLLKRACEASATGEAETDGSGAGA